VAMQDRTEPATPRKRDEARKEGRVAKSSDLISAVVLLFGLFIIRAAGPYMWEGMCNVYKDTLSNLHKNDLTVDGMQSLAISYGIRFGLICLPILVGTSAVAFVANVMQIGFRVTPKAMAPNLNKLDPIKGMTKLFSIRSAVEVFKSVLKVAVVSWFVYSFLKNAYPRFLDLAGMTPQQIGAVIGMLAWQLVIRGCMIILIIGILDFFYQKYQFEQSLKMTKQEVKDEYKRMEGDPQVKGKIKQRQFELARRRMMRDVVRADVVITNPTHYAVAIRYDSSEMSAPTVLAKGQRLLALKIREIAETNGIPIVENPPVARLLYRTVEVGQQIPEELYQAVAEILAYVYQLNEKTGKRQSAA